MSQDSNILLAEALVNVGALIAEILVIALLTVAIIFDKKSVSGFTSCLTYLFLYLAFMFYIDKKKALIRRFIYKKYKIS